MITVKCPECGAGLAVVFRDQVFDGWKQCKHCGEYSFVHADESGASEAVSLRSLIVNASERIALARALQLMLEKKRVFADELFFDVGKRVETDLKKLESYRAVRKVGNHYELNEELSEAIGELVQPLLPKKTGFDLSELDL